MSKLVVISAPSGAGKTSIANCLINRIEQLSFSISATSRSPRADEKDSVNYYFKSIDEFKNDINKNLFVEWQEVYSDKFYGTYLKELNRIWSLNKVVLLDVDVFGGINIKDKFEKNCLSIFIMPPSKNELLNRLKKRDSESQSQLLERELKMDLELNQSSKFDSIIKNIILEEACLEAEKIIRNFLK
ncbi:MAG: guanylate kinase [Flavobacteriales bacterium TMED84]|nr:MAG: guanylate kinase [Flavobacteriales bacterium TMED84]|tara:strand:+ start:4330 stop:4890 length:561 start_codon:yes stop_codon:yes gene_type:complete